MTQVSGQDGMVALYSLSLRERVGVRGSPTTALSKARPRAVSTRSAPLRSQDPLTPTLSQREREAGQRRRMDQPA